jgi:hemoglobin
MQMDESKTESGNPSAATPYDLIGGEAKVFALVDRFYDLMDETPEYYAIRKLHPAALDGSREKLKMYLSGWLGGPNLYIEQFGHPRLRARHLPFAIGINERDLWLACMFSAMEDIAVAEPLKTKLLESFFGTADWMRNREE